MHWPRAVVVGNKNDRSDVHDPWKRKVPNTEYISEETIPVNCHPLKSLVTANQPPWGQKRPLGVERREVVLEQCRRASEYFDFTKDTDDQPPAKIRRVDLQFNNTINGLARRATTCDSVSQLEKPLSEGNNLVGYASSRSGSIEEEYGKKSKAYNGTCEAANGQDGDNNKRNHSARDTSRSQLRFEKPPLLEKTSESFSIDPTNVQDSPKVTEADLGQRLTVPNHVRNSASNKGSNNSEGTSLEMPNLHVRNAMVWKGKNTIGEPFEKSLAERLGVKQCSGPIFEQRNSIERATVSSKPPKCISKPLNISNISSRGENGKDIIDVDHSASYSSGDADIDKIEKSAAFNVRESAGDDVQHGAKDDEDDFFFSSRDFARSPEDSLSTGSEHMQKETVNDLPESSRTTTANFWYKDDSRRETNETGALPSAPIRLGCSAPEDDFEEGARKLKALIRMNKKQKASPTTLFTPRHDLDKFNCLYPQKPLANISPPAQKCYHPFSKPAPCPAKLSAKLADVKDETQGAPSSIPKPVALERVPNRTGGLALLAKKAGLSNVATSSTSNTTIGYLDGQVKRTNRPTAVSAEEFQIDFSRYKRRLTQEERDVIRRHEWLKERQRDLKTIRGAYIEAAKASCIIGITKAMEEELFRVEELYNIVLDQGKHDKVKRNRVHRFRDNMARKQTCDVSDEKVEINLGMLIERKSLQRIDDELKDVEEEMEVLGIERREQSMKRANNLKKVRFASPSANGGSSRPSSQPPDGQIVESKKDSKAARPKFGTAEYRQSQSAAYWKSQAQKEAALREQLRKFDDTAIPTASTDVSVQKYPDVKDHDARPEDAESEISEEEEGFKIYPGFETASARPVTRPPEKRDDVPLVEMQRLDEERRQREAKTLLEVAQPSHKDGSVPGQAPDPALAAQMRKIRLGIPDQDSASDSDAASDTSECSEASVQMINTYTIYAWYQGMPGLEDCTQYKLGRFLRKENAEALIRDKMVEFSEARKQEIAEAMAAEDEEWLTRLGDPEAGTLRHDMKTQEQIVEYPGSSCRIAIETKRVVARNKAEKKVAAASAPKKIYLVLWRRTLADGTVHQPSATELRPCGYAALANGKACRRLTSWYAEHMRDGYLAMQQDALKQKVVDLGEEGCFDEEETFRIPGGGGEETMRVWVEEVRVEWS